MIIVPCIIVALFIAFLAWLKFLPPKHIRQAREKIERLKLDEIKMTPGSFIPYKTSNYRTRESLQTAIESHLISGGSYKNMVASASATTLLMAGSDLGSIDTLICGRNMFFVPHRPRWLGCEIRADDSVPHGVWKITSQQNTALWQYR